MFVLFILALGYESLPILNVSCPPMEISLSLNCSTLGIESRRDCECACLFLAECDIPRCAYAFFNHACAEHGNCVDTCFCQHFLCSYEYTPRSAVEYKEEKEQQRIKTEKEDDLVIDMLISILVSLVIIVFICVCIIWPPQHSVQPIPHPSIPIDDEGIDVD